jgi:acyl dehydratase
MPIIPRAVGYEDLKPGEYIGRLRYEVTQRDIDAYLDAMGIENPIYKSIESAKGAGFERIPAPPSMHAVYGTYNLLMKAAGLGQKQYAVYAKSEVKFSKPIYVGDVLDVFMHVEDKYLLRGKNYVTWSIDAYDRNGERVLKKIHTSVWQGEMK